MWGGGRGGGLSPSPWNILLPTARLWYGDHISTSLLLLFLSSLLAEGFWHYIASDLVLYPCRQTAACRAFSTFPTSLFFKVIFCLVQASYYNIMTCLLWLTVPYGLWYSWQPTVYTLSLKCDPARVTLAKIPWGLYVGRLDDWEVFMWNGGSCWPCVPCTSNEICLEHG